MKPHANRNNADVRVAFFVTCLVDQLRPEIGWGAVELLRRAGCEVDFDARQSCCGQPAFNSGYHAEAASVAKQQLRIFDESKALYDAIVTPSGSCAAMVHRFPQLISGAEEVASSTYELAGFLVNQLKFVDFGAELSGRVSWHDSCHGLRDLGLKHEPRELMAQVKGLEWVEAELAEECCGFGGTFAVKNADLSVAMADRKIDELEELGVDYVTGADLSCLMHMGGRLQRRGSKIEAVHFAELIARGLPGYSAPEGSELFATQIEQDPPASSNPNAVEV